MITRRSVSLSLAATLGALAARGARAESPPSFEEMTQRPVVYRVPGMANARVREGLVYKTVQGSPLHFDSYAPATASRATPAVILVHGGPVPGGGGARRWGMFTSYGRILAASGMIGIAFDHRLLGFDRVGDSAADLADLVTYLRQHAATLGIDANRLALWSFSLGGSLVAVPLRERQPWWKLVVAYYPMLEPPGGDRDPRLSAIASLGRDASNAPPMVVARADRDDPAINANIDRFVAAAKAAGASVDLLTHPTGRHSFDLLDAGDRSSQIIGHTLGALRKSLGLGL